MFNEHQFLGANYSYIRHSFSFFLDSMQRLDIHDIELYACAPHLYLQGDFTDKLRKIKKGLTDAGIRIHCFTAEQCFYPVSLATSDIETRARALQYYRNALSCAAELGSPLMQMISGGGLLEDDPSDNLKRSMDGLAEIVSLAEKSGVTIVLEADPDCTIRNTDEQLAAVREIGSTALSAMIDTNALAKNGEDLSDAVSKLGGELRHIHFIDIDPDRGKECLVPGEGILPMKDYLYILSEAGYRGGLTPELWGTTYHGEAEEALRRSMAFFHKHNSALQP